MKNLFGLLLLFVSTTLLGQEKNHKIIYHVSPLVKDNVPMLKIKMSFMSNITGYTELIYADNPWGQEDMQGCIVEMKLNDTKSDITRNKEKGLIQIAHTKESKTLDFEYIIKQDFEGGVKTQNYFRPIINSTYFHVISQSFFMIPSYMNSNADDRLDIEIYWDDFPENYVIHNSFGSRQRHQVIEDVSISNFQNTVFG